MKPVETCCFGELRTATKSTTVIQAGTFPAIQAIGVLWKSVYEWNRWIWVLLAIENKGKWRLTWAVVESRRSLRALRYANAGQLQNQLGPPFYFIPVR